MAIKRMIKSFVDRTMVPLVSYVRRKTAPTDAYSVLVELQRRASIESADYVQERMKHAIAFGSRDRLLDFAMSKTTVDGIVAEFGVWTGESINHIARTMSRLRGSSTTVYGFDSFEGLKEDWSGSGSPKGSFNLGGRLPLVERNVSLVTGWFDETLPRFATETTQPFSFVHVDSDTFEAAETIFRIVGDRIIPGTVIVFDEYFGYRGWRVGEYKAWANFVDLKKLAYEYLGFSTESVAVKVVCC
jgi:Methyltransferase domain